MSEHDSEGPVLGYIPEEARPRSVTSEGVNFPPEDSAGAPWGEATLQADGQARALADVDLDGLPLASVEGRLYGEMDWEEADAAAVVTMPNGWRTLLLVTLVDHEGERFLEGVSVPMGTFDRGVNPPQWRIAFGTQLRGLVAAGAVDAFGDNLDEVLAWADEAY